MKTLYARIGPKTGPEQFFRCGIPFTRAWQKVEADKATAERLQAEQMLEVTEDQPEDYVEPEGEAGDSADAGGKTPAPATAPAAPAKKK